MGISSGLPLLITISLMQAWAKEANISLANIGLMSLIGLPYTLKFLWSPIFDRLTLPFLGRRRGWLLVSQVLLMLAIIGMGQCNPSGTDWDVQLFVMMGCLITFTSASQDIIIDAYRREDLSHKQLGLGSSYYTYGYRIGMLIVSGGGLILADLMAWKWVYLVMALCLIPGAITTLLCQEPPVTHKPPSSFRESVMEPFIDYFKKTDAWLILIFIILYKLGDNMAAALTTPFYLELGFSKTQIGAIVKLFGFWSTLIGAFVGGVIILKIGIQRSLLAFGVLQMVSTAGFAVLATMGPKEYFLAAVVSFENVSAGMGTSAFIAFMASLTNKKFTATQYALLTSLMGIPRVLASSMTGFMVENLGWFQFFLFCTLIAIPGLFLLKKFATWNHS